MAENEREARRRDTNRKALEAFMEAIGDADFARLESICRPDLIVELPYSDPPKRLSGFAAYRAEVEPALEIFRFRLNLTHIYELADPDRLVAEYKGDGHATPTGKPYRNVYIGVFRFRAGRLAELREFFNPDLAREALRED